MADTVRNCNESDTSTFLKLSYLQGPCYDARRERKRVHGEALRKKGKKGKAQHTSTGASFRLAAEQHLHFVKVVLNDVAIDALGGEVGSRSSHRAKNSRTKEAEKLGEDKLRRLREAAKAAGKKRRGRQQLIAVEVARVQAAGERHAPDFDAQRAEEEGLAQDGSAVQEKAAMERLMVQDYWKKGFDKSELWVEVCVVLPDVAADLKVSLPEGKIEPRYKATIIKATSAWARDAKAGKPGRVVWKESQALRELKADVEARSTDALKLLRQAVPTIA